MDFLKRVLTDPAVTGAIGILVAVFLPELGLGFDVEADTVTNLLLAIAAVLGFGKAVKTKGFKA